MTSPNDEKLDKGITESVTEKTMTSSSSTIQATGGQIMESESALNDSVTVDENGRQSYDDVAVQRTDGTDETMNKRQRLSSSSNSTFRDVNATTTPLTGSQDVVQKNKSDDDDVDEIDEVQLKIRKAWELFAKNRNNANNDNTNERNALLDDAFSVTLGILKEKLDELLKMGLDAFRLWETTAGELKQLQKELETKDTELERLRSMEEKNHVIIQNLLRASATAQENVHDANQYIVTEAKLRAELWTINTKYGETLRQAEEYKHKSSLLQDEIRDLRVKLSRVNHEKVRLERDQRATKLSILSGLDTKVSSSSTSKLNAIEMEHQKRKIDELNGRIQAMNAVVADKDRQLDEMRRQLEREMTQNH